MATLEEIQSAVHELKFKDHEDERVVLVVQTLDKLLEQLTLRPCDVTGMHTPDHHINGTVCQDMKADTLRRMIDTLGVEWETVPHELHPEGKCHWCYDIPGQQHYRDKMIQSWEWAGRTPTAEMLEPANDQVRAGDSKRVLEALTDEFESWQVVTKRLSEGEPPKEIRVNGVPSGNFGQFFDSRRYWTTIDRLRQDGLVEVRDISARLAQPKDA